MRELSDDEKSDSSFLCEIGDIEHLKKTSFYSKKTAFCQRALFAIIFLSVIYYVGRFYGKERRAYEQKF